jgi:hypothetical protein
MTNNTRQSTRGILGQPVRPLGRVVLSLFVVLGCAPDIKQDPMPQFAVMEFDPQAAPPRAPEPTMLVINPQTGLIDFSTAGVDIPENPAECQTQQMMPVAQCEFYQYLETLDGFPTLTPLAAPVNASLDMATVTLPDRLLIVNDNPPGILDASSVALSFDPAKNVLQAMPVQGWNVGSTYIVAVRGYDNGVKTEQGNEVLSSVPYFLLKKDDSLTCGAAEPGLIAADCGYYQLMLQQTPDNPSAAAEGVFGLEMMRQAYLGFWAPLAGMGMPKAEVAIVWAFPIHSASVAELNPQLGMLPFTTANSLSIRVKGSVSIGSLDAADVMVFGMTENTALGISGITYTPPDIVVTLSGSMIPGGMYVVLLTNGITNELNQPLVASPMTVLARTRGPLFANGQSMMSTLDSASAEQFEQLRFALAPFLDGLEMNPGITREQIAYLYSFVYEAAMR